ncbi:oxidoreductase [Paecilomyces variotii No. 5]|uniref:Oxidoreductase n=1 Tax=Byssochlamys spectabilis (strain No. 5 / NBRC 109023) TaxID=1356009 RepID=V5HTZ0_BYSSN|nr:oxidoreductase [Paecilomyces variotii No. 5]
MEGLATSIASPGALQHWVWESGSNPNETCFVTAGPETPCHQGRVPLFSALADSAAQVRQAVRFAKQHNLRLVIRNTGHDGAGLSSSPDSFQIHTHLLQGIEYHTDFEPNGSLARMGSAVTVGAGVLLGDLYARGSLEGYTVVGGECPTVGAAGGFLQGGGVSSFLSHTWGLAVDNVLQFEVVTAQGDLVVANAYQNQDLFWALRGGGGGTFGVVTRATVRTYADLPVVVAKLTIAASDTDAVFWTKGVTTLLTLLQELNSEDVPGQFILSPQSGSGIEASLTMYFINETKTARVDDRLNPLETILSGEGITPALSSQALPHISMDLRKGPDIYPEDYGILMSSVLVSNRLFNSSEGPRRMAETFARLHMGPQDLLFTSNLGGRVIANGHVVDTAMNPAWRSASQLVNFVRNVDPSIVGKSVALEDLTNVQMPLLYSIDPEFKASYLNLADPSEKDSRRVFWGEHYERLSQIKRKWDPEDLFITNLGVGSDNWETDGMCRKPRNLVDHATMSTPRIIDIRRSKFEGSIRDQVVDGLTKSPKTLPALLFYSTEGIQHWIHHSHFPDFYPRSDEIRVLKKQASEMAASIANNSIVVDLGSASLDKVTFLLEALEDQQKNIDYYALDLSSSELATTLDNVPIDRFHHVRFAGLHGTFDDGLQWLKETPEIRDRPHCILLLGLTIGNFSRQNAASFLQSIAYHALSTNPAQSSILVTLDSCKEPTKVLRAYTSPGVVPFALSALKYANTLLRPEDAELAEGPTFNIDDWYFLSEWNYVLGRHEASLIPQSKNITLGPPLQSIVVSREEKIRFGCSYKYNRAEKEELFGSAGLAEAAAWSDAGCDVAFYLLKMMPN